MAPREQCCLPHEMTCTRMEYTSKHMGQIVTVLLFRSAFVHVDQSPDNAGTRVAHSLELTPSTTTRPIHNNKFCDKEKWCSYCKMSISGAPYLPRRSTNGAPRLSGPCSRDRSQFRPRLAAIASANTSCEQDSIMISRHWKQYPISVGSESAFVNTSHHILFDTATSAYRRC